MALKSITALEGALIVNLPLASVCVPIFLPLTCTVTPVAGLPLLSVTVPFISCTFCAMIYADGSSKSIMKNAVRYFFKCRQFLFLILLIFQCLNEADFKFYHVVLK